MRPHGCANKTSHCFAMRGGTIGGRDALRHPDCLMSILVDDALLLSVEKPARYTGNELNMVRKDPGDVSIRYAFCFPDTYEVGMSHLGMKILYHVLNLREDTYCERFFAPWTDMAAKMRERGMPLFSLETRTPLSEFDFAGFTLQYEMSYTSVLDMLDMGGVPVLTRDRGLSDPFVMGGGPCACNPEPLADFFDLFVIGEGEEVIGELMDAHRAWKGSGASREAYLEAVAGIEGVYVPSFYHQTYHEDGTVEATVPTRACAPERVRRRIVRDLDAVPYPDAIIVPFVQTVHDRVMLELFRGCIRGCRFCQAGIIYRPVRERSVDALAGLAERSLCNTGYEELSMMSLSTSDYSKLPELTDRLLAVSEDKKVNLAVPSLRVDNFSLGLMDRISKVRKSGLTFAPEAGSQRLRDVINKGVTDENLLSSVCQAVAGGWSSVKLYFMLGLPTETMEDVDAIAELGFRLLEACRGMEGASRLKISMSASTFVPKPFTPFQWEPQDTMAQMREKQYHLKDRLRRISKRVDLSWHDNETSFLEAVLARGDRRLGKVVYRAWRAGCRFDSWREHFRYDLWIAALAEEGLDPAFYANRRRAFTEVLPWDHIDIGVTRTFLRKEMEKATQAELTRNCANGCAGCGAAEYEAGICPKSPR